MDRRSFLRALGAGAVGASGSAGALALAACGAGAAGEPSLSPRSLALAVDLAACNRKPGCRSCIDACHAAHNVPSSSDPSRQIKWLWKERFDQTFRDQVHDAMPAPRRAQTVLVLCNHCVSPACTRVCPTGATWRRADGIVMIDEHRCIGCRYCMAACPYGARSFNWQDPRPSIARIDPSYPTRTAGVVEKCTFCAERIAAGRPPACVEACDSAGGNALAFGDLEEAESRLVRLLASRTVLRRKPELSTSPRVFYLV